MVTTMDVVHSLFPSLFLPPSPSLVLSLSISLERAAAETQAGANLMHMRWEKAEGARAQPMRKQLAFGYRVAHKGCSL